MADKVIFRRWSLKHGAGVVAIFPQIPGDCDGRLAEMYEHVGQHGAGDVSGVIQGTRAAKPNEYRSLAKELRKIGYRLKIGRKATRRDYDIRRKEAARQCGR